MSFAAWRILADDLTGALDSAAAFCGVAQVPVLLQAPTGEAHRGVPTQALVTGSRDIPIDALPALLQSSLPWLVGGTSAPVMSFKKVDSLVRGNTFAEVAWLAKTGAFDGVVFAPGYPAQGRFTQGGQHWTQTTNPSGLAAKANEVDLLAAFAAQGVAAQALPDLSGSLTRLSGVVIPDVNDDAALERLAAFCRSEPHMAQRWLWCGSAGLAGALAQAAHTVRPAALTVSPEPIGGPLCLITASRHPVLRRQLQALTSVGERALLLDLATDQPLTASEARAQLAQQTRHLVHTLPRPALLVVVGGDTLLALCQASGAHTLLAHASPRPGWGLARFQGGQWNGITCFSRSGAFGAPDDLVALLDTLFDTFPQKETAP